MRIKIVRRFFDTKKKKKIRTHFSIESSPFFETQSIEFRIVGDNLLGRSPLDMAAFFLFLARGHITFSLS